jgi:hypothetical protein
MAARPTAPFSLVSRAAVAILALVLAGRPAAAQLPVQAQAVPGEGQFASVRGIVTDSLHATPLVRAVVRIDGLTKEALTDENGEYSIDSIPPGAHKMLVLHQLLDTLGIALVTPSITLTAGKREIVDMAVPSSQRLVGLLCPAARLQLGPAALVGFVREADSEAPAEGSRVSLLWYESDPLGLRKTPRVRESVVGADGRYRICGIPGEMSGGKLQVFKNGVSTGEVPVEVTDGYLALRSMSIGLHAEVAVVPAQADTNPKTAGDTSRAATPTRRVLRGRARVTGRVLGKGGAPVPGARVGIQGTSAVAITRANGEFTLDSLPSGTQTVEVRKLGYQLAEEPVELSALTPASVTVSMTAFVPTLEPMRVTATRERGLQDVGFAMRQRSGMGHYLEGDQIPKTQQVTDALRVIPGLRVQPSGNANVVTSSRDPNGGCVTFFVDGTPWQQQFPGDLDSYVRSDEIAAIEVYNSSTVPAQFTSGGRSNCTTIVLWTERRINRKRN